MTGAEFGAFFYNVTEDRSGALPALHALRRFQGGVCQVPAPARHRDASVPTFRGEGIVRMDDVTKDPRYGRNAPYHGLPPGHLPVRSYLAVPVGGGWGR